MTMYKEIEAKDKRTKKMIKMTVIEKRLTFRNSYSIIPAALASFGKMFQLNVHKEVMAYKTYTEKTICKCT